MPTVFVHNVNLSSLLNFITAVDAGHWEARDPRSLGGLM